MGGDLVSVYLGLCQEAHPSVNENHCFLVGEIVGLNLVRHGERCWIQGASW